MSPHPPFGAPYAPLYCKSNYSFLEGASHPDELVEEAHRMGLRALALTDRDGVYGMVRAQVKAEELGLQLITGAEVTLFDGTALILLAADRPGYANLCRLLSKGRLRSPKGLSQVSVEEVCEHAPGLLALWGGARASIRNEIEPRAMAGKLREAFGDALYALLTRHFEAGEKRAERRLRDRAKQWDLPLAAGMEVLYHTPARRPLQDVLTCIRHGVTLPTAGRLIQPNAEHALRPPQGFALLYADDPAAVQRTVEIAERCRFSLREIRYRYPSERLPEGSTSAAWMRELTFQGADRRWKGDVPVEARSQIEKELALIHELEFEGYFLTMEEIVRYCAHKNIFCQGRGSAANSVVCYCLGITAVDPIRMGLLFERFLSRERPEPPDIDLDIEHCRREEVIQHVYTKYGRSHAAMVANFIRYRPKSSLRDIGKVLGIPETNLERMTKVLSHHEFPSDEVLGQAGLESNTPAHQHLMRLMWEIEDFPRHLSIHPGGFLLGHEPVDTLVPIENATMPGRTVIQWDKNDVDDLGLFKVDLLGLGALNVVHRAFDLIELHSGEQFTLATVPPKDPATYAMIQRADTVGTFQIESRAQMSMLPRLRPENYYDLVIQVSIVRPGPITGGMVHPYLRRRQGLEAVTYPHPCLEPVLKKTLGIPLFQEQVMQLAMVAADYTPGEADQLRRDMAAWRKTGRIERHRERLIGRMIRKGIQKEFAERVFEQIRGFGEYGFPESHAASFALIAYVTAWLKCHHPAAFLCALLNAQPMGFYSAASLIEDGKRHNLEIRPIDIQHSHWECTLEPLPPPRARARNRTRNRSSSSPPFALRMGLRYVKGLAETDAQRILNARHRSVGVPPAPSPLDGGGAKRQGMSEESTNPLRALRDFVVILRMFHHEATKNTKNRPKSAKPELALTTSAPSPRTILPFTSLEDLAARAGIGQAILSRLAECGALESLQPERRSALWESLAAEDAQNEKLPLLWTEPGAAFTPLDAFQEIHWDYASTDHSVRGHPLAPLREALAAQGLPDAATLQGMKHGQRVRYAGLVICRQRPGTAQGVVFMTLEDETGLVNLVLWQKVFQQHELLAKTQSFLGVTGKLQIESGVTHLVVEDLWSPEIETTPAETKSRDFH